MRNTTMTKLSSRKDGWDLLASLVHTNWLDVVDVSLVDHNTQHGRYVRAVLP